MQVLKRDSNLFRERVTLWQEAYMENMIGEYKSLLSSSVLASTKFLEFEKE